MPRAFQPRSVVLAFVLAASPAWAQRAPGTFEVDEEAAVDRALERALVREGALLLPSGAYEVGPFFSYRRSDDDAPLVISDSELGSIAAEVQERRSQITAGLTLRAGLPGGFQFEATVPYEWETETGVTRVGFGGVDERDRSEDGPGDVVVSLSKALLAEARIAPSLVGSVVWDTDTGSSNDGALASGSGFHEWGFNLTATKRQDPLVFVGGLGYRTALEDDGVKPGDEVSLTLGVVLAASPETSLRALIGQSFVREAEVDGEGVPGSRDQASTLSLGVSWIVGRRTLVDASAGVGVTDNGTDFVFRLALPTRFDLD